MTDDATSKSRIYRRELLSGGAVGMMASTAGCIDHVNRVTGGYPSLKVEFRDETDCFEEIELAGREGWLPSGIDLAFTISTDCDADYVILYDKEGQHSVRTLYTGETRTTIAFNQDTPHAYQKVAAVSGGDVSWNRHTGGEVVEEAPIRVWYDE